MHNELVKLAHEVNRKAQQIVELEVLVSEQDQSIHAMDRALQDRDKEIARLKVELVALMETM